MGLADRLKARREMYENMGAAKKIDRSKPEAAARALGSLKNNKNKNVQKEFNKGAGN